MSIPCHHRRVVIHSLLVAGFLCGPVDIATAGGFPSENVTLLSQVALEDFPGQPIRGNDCWGYVSPSGREYALMGLYNEVAVVEVTSPSDPVIIAEISHAPSNWCDIKVYQDHAYAVNKELARSTWRSCSVHGDPARSQ